ncbi:MAG: TonB-dependent receptor [Cytophagales bacterium]|nr:TonB-dependent receptor [Cytophagales bacterium]MDW8383946.1 TonB-dependent receptor [Flammeovirgaceae bacterium]
MKKQVFFFFLIGCFFHLKAQQLSISGKVTDENGAPLSGATIILNQTFKGTVSDAEGNYTLSNLKPGTYTITFSYLGYESKTENVELSQSNLVIDVQFTKVTSLPEIIITDSYRADEQTPVTQKTVELQQIEAKMIGQDGLFLMEKLSPSFITSTQAGTGFTNYGDFRLRGMPQKRVNITLNGVPLNDMIDQGVYFSNFTDIMNSVQSFQIQRGVGTSVNGTASYAGSINFESANLNEGKSSGDLQYTTGSFNTHKLSAEYKTGLLPNNFAFYGRFSQITTDGFKKNSGTESYSFFFSGGYFGKKDIFKLTAFNGQTKNQLAYLNEPKNVLERDYRTNSLDVNDKDDFGQQFAQLQHIHTFHQRQKITSSLYYGGAGGIFPFGFPFPLYTTNKDSTSPAQNVLVHINYPLQNRHFGFMSIFNNRSLNGRTDWSTGVHVYTFLRENKEGYLPQASNPYYFDKVQKNEASAFAKLSHTQGKTTFYADVQLRAVSMDMKLQYSFTDELDPQARTPIFNPDTLNIPTYNWLFINPKVGLTYEVNQNLQAYISLGRTGREPTRYDILGSWRIKPSNLINVRNTSYFKEEYVNDLELGIKYRKNRSFVELNGFYMLFQNEITPIGSIVNGFIDIQQNVPSSYRAGIELDYQYDITPKWQVLGNLTYMQSRVREYRSGDTAVFKSVQQILSPEWLINYGVQYCPFEVLQIGLSARYISEQFMELTNNPDFKVPSSHILDGYLRWKFYKEHSLNVQVNNLFNQKYYTSGAPVDPTYSGNFVPGFLIQPLRSVFITAHLKF